MATKQALGDKFANIAYLDVTESAANTLTFAQLVMANNLLSEKAAVIIHRMELKVGDLASLNGTGDFFDAALCLSDRITTLSDLSQPEILAFVRFLRHDIGAAATGSILLDPVIRDFTNLPGGGLLVPADRLYIGAKASGAAAAMVATMRLYYTVMPLQVSDYWELIEARRIMTT